MINFKSLVAAPAGYKMLRNEVVNPCDIYDDPEALDACEALGVGIDSEDISIFRVKVRCPDGALLYSSVVIESKALLCKIDFWRDLWVKLCA